MIEEDVSDKTHINSVPCCAMLPQTSDARRGCIVFRSERRRSVVRPNADPGTCTTYIDADPRSPPVLTRGRLVGMDTKTARNYSGQLNE